MGGKGERIMKKRFMLFVDLTVVLLAVFTLAFAVTSTISENEITEEEKIKIEKQKTQTLLPTPDLTNQAENSTCANFTENEKAIYNEIMNDPKMDNYKNITFTKDIAKSISVKLNDRTINLAYYFTNVSQATYEGWKNPEKLDLIQKSYLYRDDNKDLYSFGIYSNKLTAFYKYDFTISDDDKKITQDESINILKNFAKDVVTDFDKFNLKMISPEDHYYYINMQNKKNDWTYDEIKADISYSGEIILLQVNSYGSDENSNDKMKATDAKLDQYIKANYKKLFGYEIIGKRVMVINDIPIIQYSVCFTDDNKYKSQFAEIILLKLE